MPREKILLISEQEQTKEEIRYKIENDLIDNESYQALSQDEQNKVKAVLFEMYAQPVPTPQALAAIEIMLFLVSKIVLQNAAPSSFSQQESDGYALLKELVENHPATFDIHNYHIHYVLDKAEKTLESRNQYFQDKFNITGTI